MLSCIGVCLVEEDDDYGYTAKPRHPYLDQILRQREDPDYYDGDDLSIPLTTVCPSHYFRVPTAQGKQGKWPKRFPVRGKNGNLEVWRKHREFCLLK